MQKFAKWFVLMNLWVAIGGALVGFAVVARHYPLPAAITAYLILLMVCITLKSH